MAKRWNVKKKINAFEKMKRTLPVRLGNKYKNHFIKAFNDEAFSYDTPKSDPWKARKYQTKEDKRTNKRRALLVQSGSLKRSIKVKRATWSKIQIGSYGIPYASYHNKGTRDIPQRQFIGKSPIVEKQVGKLIQNEIKHISKL